MTPDQQRLFEMLREIVAICDEHGLVYYTAGGTTLGAVRHRGFIPWDDDIDIMMPRSDWERFLQISEQGLPPGRALCCRELYDDYPNAFGRYVDTTSSCIHRNQLFGDMPEGFAIDVFILDPVPDAGDAYEKHRETLALYTDLANPVGYSYPMVEDVDRLRNYTKRIKQEGRAAVLGELERELARYDEKDCDYVVMRWGGAPRLFPKDMLYPPRDEMFEGLAVKVPGRCNDYLVRHYGDDWMYLPPSSGRASHDTVAALDVDYKTMQADYLPFVNVERSKKAMLARRGSHVKHAGDLRRADELRAAIIAEFACMSVEQNVRSCGFDLEEALAQHRHDDLNAVFCEFYARQTTREFVGYEEYPDVFRYYHPICIELDADLLRIALLNMVETNRVGKASRILDIQERVHGALAPQLQEVRETIRAVRRPASLYDAGLAGEAMGAARELLEGNPWLFSVRVLYLRLLSEANRSSDVEAVAARGLELFPGAGEFEKYLVDVRFDAAQSPESRQAAAREYGAAVSHTTHGLIAYDVRSKLAVLDSRGETRTCDGEPGSAVSDAAAVPDAAAGCDELASLDAVKSSQVVPGPARTDAERLRSKMAKLLCELRAICQEQGIRYFLGPISCRLALSGEAEPATPQLDLLVPAQSLPVLVEAIEAQRRPDRVLDYWQTNENHLTYQVDYVDATTTFLQLDEGTDVQAHGMRVSVVPIRADVGGKRGAWLDLLETGWEINGYKFTKRISAKRAMAAGVARIAMVPGKRRLAKRLYRDFGASYGGTRAPSVVRLADKAPIRGESSWFEEGATAKLYGAEFNVPSGADELLERAYGPNWRAETPAWRPWMKNSLVAAGIPYADLLDRLDGASVSLQELFGIMARVRLSMLPLANELRVRTRTLWVADRSAERHRLYLALNQRDSEISALSDRGDYDGLQAIFADYETAAKRYLRHDLGLCPHKRYLDVLCDLLRRKGEGAIADKLEKLVPHEHYTQLGG